jgi:hypothetical protein
MRRRSWSAESTSPCPPPGPPPPAHRGPGHRGPPAAPVVSPSLPTCEAPEPPGHGEGGGRGEDNPGHQQPRPPGHGRSASRPGRRRMPEPGVGAGVRGEALHMGGQPVQFAVGQRQLVLYQPQLTVLPYQDCAENTEENCVLPRLRTCFDSHGRAPRGCVLGGLHLAAKHRWGPPPQLVALLLQPQTPSTRPPGRSRRDRPKPPGPPMIHRFRRGRRKRPG